MPGPARFGGEEKVPAVKLYDRGIGCFPPGRTVKLEPVAQIDGITHCNEVRGFGNRALPAGKGKQQNQEKGWYGFHLGS